MDASVLLYVFGSFPINHLIMFSLSLIIFTLISIIFFPAASSLYKPESKAAQYLGWQERYMLLRNHLFCKC